jgi:predicted transcriptional regulator
MTAKYRSKTDIVAQILEVAAANGSGISKTKIMYGAFLSYEQQSEYLPLLIENNLLGYDPSNRTFKTTEKGLRFLKLYEQVNQLTTIIEEGENELEHRTLA